MPGKQSPKYALLALGFALSVFACSLFSGGTGAVPTPPVAETVPVQPTPSEAQPQAPTATADLTAACPQPSDGFSLYASQENGFCFLYPAHFSLEPNSQYPEEGIILRGPLLPPPPKSQETIGVSLFISLNGPAAGLDSAQYANRWRELTQTQEGTDSQATIGGYPAAVIDGVPGFVAGRSAFMIVNGYKYSLTLYPQPDLVPELSAEANAAWEAVTASLAFFQPQTDRQLLLPEEVCPQSGEGTLLYIDLLDGYCLLYPVGSELDAQLPGRIVGGPILGSVPDFPDVRTSLTVGTFGYFPGKTPLQVLEPRMDQIDPGYIQDATFGGQPGVVFRNLAGPWAARNAIIVVGNGDVYTIVAQPWEPERWPQGIEYLDRLWNTVSGSLTFFHKWR